MRTAKLIGGAGTGKTTRLLEIMDKLIDRIGDPMNIGFATFTRQARRVASNRAADRFGVAPHDLERTGYFRTLHATCKHLLGINQKEQLTNNAESREWLQNMLQEPINLKPDDGDSFSDFFVEDTDAGLALKIWRAARAKLTTLNEAWEVEAYSDDRTPPLNWCIEVVSRYEQAKRVDHRCDFTDMLTRFAGWSFSPRYGPEQGDPEGNLPNDVEAWFFDEYQDTSPLMHAVTQRLISGRDVRYAYYVGDPFQSIFGWAGADPKYLMGCDTDREDIMPQSHRCPAEILELGERVLSECSDYFDRKIAPKSDGGEIITRAFSNGCVDEIDPADSWLVLARTNREAKRLARRLDQRSIPWQPLKGGGTWVAPVRNEVIKAMKGLQDGAPIDGEQWKRILTQLPRPVRNGYVEHGTAARFNQLDDPQGEYPWVQDIRELGGTDHLCEIIKTGQWVNLVKGAKAYLKAIEQWGENAIDSSQVRVGTIHSAKGEEADNVLLLTNISHPTRRSMDSESGRDEEQRVWYVAATRAKKRLVIVRDKRARYRKRLPL
jgi:DNA helicase-2/ATP-dependent DNA helicase PcrA